MIRPDHAPFFHNDLGGPQAALPILIVDEWQDPVITLHRAFSITCLELFHHRFDQIGDQCRTHGTGSAGIKIGHQGDPFFSVERTKDIVPTLGNQCTQFSGCLRRLDLEVLEQRDRLCHSNQ